MRLFLYGIFLAIPLCAQTAVTELSSFWEVDLTAEDRILWDYKGHAHGMYISNGNVDGGLVLPETVFGHGFIRTPGNTNLNIGALSIPGSLINTTGRSFCYAIWSRHQGTNSLIGQWNGGESPRSWLLRFNTTVNGRGELRYRTADATDHSLLSNGSATTVNAGVLSLVWMAFNVTTGALTVAVNGDSWTSQIPASPFVNDLVRPLDFGHIVGHYYNTGSPVIGRTMFWNGYIPTDAERVTIYNGGAGQSTAYFGLSLNHPERPITMSMVNATFADDTLLTDQGLYFLRPFPLKNWSPTLAAARGDYVWVRSTDHLRSGSVTGGDSRIGYSSSPGVLPASWSRISLISTEPTFSWFNFETPSLEYESGTFYLYAHAQRLNSSNPVVQATHVFTSTDLVTWTWRSYFPNNMTSGHTYNHTGYGNIVRNGVGDWTAQTVIDSGETGTDGTLRFGLWSSVDGITWTLIRETTMMNLDSSPVRVTNSANGPVGPFRYEFNLGYVGVAATQFELMYPAWFLVMHDGDGSYNATTGIGQWLQDVRAYEEHGTVWLYAKWSFREPSTTRLFVGHYPSSRGRGIMQKRGNATIR